MNRGHKSFLVINVFGIGDVLFSTPLLRNLRDNFTTAKIYYLCNKKTASLLQNHPLIEKVFVYERDEFVAAQKKSFFALIRKYWQFISEIRRERIECAIDLSLNAPFGLFALLAGIKKRYGLNYKNRSRFLNRTVKIDGFIDKHVADYYLDALKLLDIPVKRCHLEVYTDNDSKAWAGEFLNQNGISGNQFIGIAPCGGAAFGKDAFIKRWPADKYPVLIDKLIAEFKAKIFIFAGPQEKSDVEKILSLVQHKDSCFEFTAATLPQTIALVERCNLFIGNDTGPLRFADALDKKTIAIFGPVDDNVYGLYPKRKTAVVIKKDMPCRPCYQKFRLAPCRDSRKCLNDISFEDVMSAVKELWTIQ